MIGSNGHLREPRKLLFINVNVFSVLVRLHGRTGRNHGRRALRYCLAYNDNNNNNNMGQQVTEDKDNLRHVLTSSRSVSSPLAAPVTWNCGPQYMDDRPSCADADIRIYDYVSIKLLEPHIHRPYSSWSRLSEALIDDRGSKRSSTCSSAPS